MSKSICHITIYLYMLLLLDIASGAEPSKFMATLVTAVSRTNEQRCVEVGAIFKKADGALCLVIAPKSLNRFAESFSITTFSKIGDSWPILRTEHFSCSEDDWSTHEYGVAVLNLSQKCTATQIRTFSEQAILLNGDDPTVTAYSSVCAHTFCISKESGDMPIYARGVLRNNSNTSRSIDALDILDKLHQPGAPLYVSKGSEVEGRFLGLIIHSDTSDKCFVRKSTIADIVNRSADSMQGKSEINSASSSDQPLQPKSIQTNDHGCATFIRIDDRFLMAVFPRKVVANGIKLIPCDGPEESLASCNEYLGSLSWTSTEYALSFAYINVEGCPENVLDLIAPLAYCIRFDGRSGLLADSFTFVHEPCSNKISPCVAHSISPHHGEILYNITANCELRAGQAVSQLGLDGKLYLEGIVTEAVNFASANKPTVICAEGKLLSMDYLRQFISESVSAISTQRDSCFRQLIKCHIAIKSGDKILNGLIASSKSGEDFLVTAKHVVPQLTHSTELFLIGSNVQYGYHNNYHAVPLGKLDWRFNETDVAAARLDTTQMTNSDRILLKNAANDVSVATVNSQSFEIESDCFLTSVSRNQVFVRKAWKATPTFISTYSPVRGAIFGVYPGTVSGTSGSPVYSDTNGTPMLCGIVSARLEMDEFPIVTMVSSVQEIAKIVDLAAERDR